MPRLRKSRARPGATSGALYSNFASKEDLFLALFEERIATDVGDYSQIVAEGATIEEQARGAADHWIEILRERPDYFPLLMEFWAYAIREPALRGRLAERFAALRSASGRLFMEAAERHGDPPPVEAGEFVGLLINALGNGLAFEKLADPEAVPDALFGDMLVLIFRLSRRLRREDPGCRRPAECDHPAKARYHKEGSKEWLSRQATVDLGMRPATAETSGA